MSVIRIESTTANEGEAKKIATALVQQRLAACVQISGPIESVYRWSGDIQTDQEWCLSIKTLEHRYTQVEQLIRSLHSYDEPQIVAFQVTAGSAGYLDWVEREATDSNA